jgi:hypothetical protein
MSNKISVGYVRKHRASIAAVIIILTVIVVILWPVLFETTFGRRASEDQVRQLAAALTIGESADDVAATLSQPEYGRLRLMKIKDETWIVRTPEVLGARNWVVWLSFDAKRLSRLAIRTADSIDEIPSGAPPDKNIER